MPPASSPRLRLSAGVGALLCLGAVACSGAAPDCGGAARKVVVIPPGSTFRAATDSLAAAGLLRQPAAFRAYAKVKHHDRDIKAGTYSFVCARTSWSSMLAAMAQGPSERRVTIPEGFAISDIVPILSAALGAPADSVRAAARDTALLHELEIPSGSLEGYLFPDTYRFAEGTAPRVAIREMVRRFQQVWQPAWDAQLQKLAMSRHDVVTLASIVEKEARLAEERPVISAVYHNRLRAQMPLQADPTVQYARGQHTTRVLYKDLEVDSPYNTYRHKGLPPGPIASPGRASIEASLYPADVPYRFFVAGPDGHHEFRVTFREHTEARAQLRRARPATR